MNKCVFIGHLTKDPELKELTNGKVCNFCLAVKRDYTKNGERETDYFTCTAWRGLAEVITRYVHKGDRLAVYGSIQNRTYEDRDGNKKSVSEIVVDDVDFLTPKKDKDDDSGVLPF